MHQDVFESPRWSSWSPIRFGREGLFVASRCVSRLAFPVLPYHPLLHLPHITDVPGLTVGSSEYNQSVLELHYMLYLGISSKHRNHKFVCSLGCNRGLVSTSWSVTSWNNGNNRRWKKSLALLYWFKCPSRGVCTIKKCVWKFCYGELGFACIFLFLL